MEETIMQVLEMKYFVLKPKAKNGYDIFARASQDAMLAYSDRIRTITPLFADQLICWAEKEKAKQDHMLKKPRLTSRSKNDQSP